MSGLKIIIAFFVSFIIAQLTKTLAAYLCGERNVKKYLLASGGMPSGHSAGISAAAVCIGLTDGFNSSIFGFAIVMAAIIIYDSVNVRYAVGEQGKILNLLTKKKMKVVEGHTRREVVAGILLGIVVGWMVYITFGA